MKKRFLAIILLASIMLFAFSACEKKNIDYDYTFAGKTYIYEKEGLGGTFTLSIKTDGTFTYTMDQDDLETAIQLSQTFVLDTKAEHDAFREALAGNIVVRVTDGTVN